MLHEVTIKVRVDAPSIEGAVRKVQANLVRVGLKTSSDSVETTPDVYRTVGGEPVDEFYTGVV